MLQVLSEHGECPGRAVRGGGQPPHPAELPEGARPPAAPLLLPPQAHAEAHQVPAPAQGRYDSDILHLDSTVDSDYCDLSSTYTNFPTPQKKVFRVLI